MAGVGCWRGGAAQVEWIGQGSVFGMLLALGRGVVFNVIGMDWAGL